MDTINECSFPYTDRILSNWLDKNVRTTKDIEELDKTYKNKYASPKTATKNSFSNFEQREYNNDELEKLLFTKTKHDF